jgi:hypothetical protein
MDFTGTRRYGRENDDSTAARFFEWVATEMRSRVQPEQRFHPLTHEPVEPEAALVIRNWRLAGYYLASFLLPQGRQRRAVELESLLAGARQRAEEYEGELEHEAPGVSVAAFDVDGAERLESKAEKFLRLATHEGTPPEEARAAAFALAKLISGGELALLAWGRVRHFAERFQKMQELFDMLQAETPWLFLYGARAQRRSAPSDH